MTTVTLLDGTKVDSASEEWRLECAQRGRHVETALRIQATAGREAVKEYIRQMRDAEGDEAATRVKARMAVVWEQRQAAQEST